MLQLMRNNKMKGIGEQFQYILRDESIHIAYGRDLINGIVAENPEVWTEEFKAKVIDLFKQATAHELAYVEDCLSHTVCSVWMVIQWNNTSDTSSIVVVRWSISYSPRWWKSIPMDEVEIMDLRKEKTSLKQRSQSIRQRAILSGSYCMFDSACREVCHRCAKNSGRRTGFCFIKKRQ